MKKSGICPKCKKQDIQIIKDIFHSNGAGNISKSKHIFRENKSALVTFYICTNCGYVEEYLDFEELKKIK